MELAIEKLKIHRSPGIDKTPKELVKAGSRKILHENNKLIIVIWNE